MGTKREENIERERERVCVLPIIWLVNACHWEPKKKRWIPLVNWVIITLNKHDAMNKA
jgi:hypothetical protein